MTGKEVEKIITKKLFSSKDNVVLFYINFLPQLLSKCKKIFIYSI